MSDLTNSFDLSTYRKAKPKRTGAYGLDFELESEVLMHNSPYKTQNLSIPAPNLYDDYEEDEFIISRR